MRVEGNGFEVRAYLPGDEEEIVKLFNLAYKDYAGFVPRTTKYWLWSCRARPGVDNDGILVVEKDQGERLVGFAVLGKTGDIWEFCVEPNADKKYVTTILLENAIKYLSRVGAEKVVLNVPAEDSVVTEVLERADFIKFPADMMFIGVTDFEAVTQLLALNSKDKLKEFEGTFSFGLKKTRPWTNPRFTIRIESGHINVVRYTESDCILIEMDEDVLVSILIGISKPFRLLMQRRLKVRPLRETFKTIKFLSMIQIRDPWFYSRAGFG